MKDMLGNEAVNLPEIGEEEIWVECEDWPGYFVSSFGNVRGKKSKKILIPYQDKNGYLKVWLYNTLGRKKVLISRLVAQAFCDGWDEEHNICDHIDRCRCNNYYKNLRWQNASESMRNRKVSKPRTNYYTTPILLISHNGKVLRRFVNPKEAVEELHVSKHQLYQQLNQVRVAYPFGYFMRETDWEALQDAE